jgi:hypothetical protein
VPPEDGAAPLPLSPHHDAANSCQHAVRAYNLLRARSGTAAADAAALDNLHIALMSVRTAAVEMRVTDAAAHVVREASGAPGVSTSVVSDAATGAPVGTLSYDFVALPLSGVCPHAAAPAQLLAHTPGECTAVYATHERAFAPGAWPACVFAGGRATPGTALRAPSATMPYAPALQCCVDRPLPVQRPSLEVSNHPLGPLSASGLGVGFLGMALRLNAPTLDPSSPSELLDATGAPLEGAVVMAEHPLPEAANGPAVTPARLTALSNATQQYVRADSVLGALDTRAAGFAVGGWVFPAGRPRGDRGAMWLVGWTHALPCGSVEWSRAAVRENAVAGASGLLSGTALYLTSDGALAVVTVDKGRVNGSWTTSPRLVAAHEWHHVLLSLNSALQGSVYVDGAAVLTFALAHAPEALLLDAAPGVLDAAFALGGMHWNGQQRPEARLQSQTEWPPAAPFDQYAQFEGAPAQGATEVHDARPSREPHACVCRSAG